MSVQLVKGVNLHVIPTEKYKTVRLLVRFEGNYFCPQYSSGPI